MSVAHGTLTITDASTPGLMLGLGEIDSGNTEHGFAFVVREGSSGSEAGYLTYEVTISRPGPDERHRFRTTHVDEVSFVNVPGTTAGRRSASGIDTVLFKGRGTWDGHSGYRFEARATDAGEHRRGRDSFEIQIRNGAGAIVATVDATITAGNIQSLRTR